MLELILGGARSGKSTLALDRARESGRDVVFIATATPSNSDAEMRDRIERHRLERPSHWTTLEVSVQLGAALRALNGRNAFVIVDCMTLWLSNVLYPFTENNATGADDAALVRERTALLQALNAFDGDAVLVSNEVGLGLVPDSAVGRHFRDEQGRLNQQLAAVCQRVTFVAAGLPLTLKEPRSMR
jgi:adenosylcobinamide kinase / adenosylcobinamide-phosphate guanylyltransferase